MEYTGYCIETFNDEELSKFYEEGYDCADLYENQYLMIKNEKGEVIDKYKFQNGELNQITYPIIDSNFYGVLKPRNPEQYLAFDMLKDQRTGVKLLTGPYGSGKDCSMISQALASLESGRFNKIIYVRNNIQVKDTEDIGILPGTEVEKLMGYLMVFADHVGGKDEMLRLIDEEKFEPIHLGYLRGRDIRNSLIYCTEAQNLSEEHIKLLLGRVGEGSELWLNGDFHAQVDKSIFERSPGIKRMVETLRGDENFAYVHLVKTERSKISALADKMDRG